MTLSSTASTEGPRETVQRAILAGKTPCSKNPQAHDASTLMLRAIEVALENCSVQCEYLGRCLRSTPDWEPDDLRAMVVGGLVWPYRIEDVIRQQHVIAHGITGA